MGKMMSLQDQIDELEKQKNILEGRIYELKCGQLLESYLEKYQNGYGIVIPYFLVSEALKRGYVVVTDDIQITITATACFYDKKGWSDFDYNSYQEFYISKLKFSKQFVNDAGEIAPTLEFEYFDDWYTNNTSENNDKKLYFIGPNNNEIVDNKRLIHHKSLYSISNDIGEKFYQKKLILDMDSENYGDWDEPMGVKGNYTDKAVLISKSST